MVPVVMLPSTAACFAPVTSIETSPPRTRLALTMARLVDNTTARLPLSRASTRLSLNRHSPDAATCDRRRVAARVQNIAQHRAARRVCRGAGRRGGEGRQIRAAGAEHQHLPIVDADGRQIADPGDRVLRIEVDRRQRGPVAVALLVRRRCVSFDLIVADLELSIGCAAA